MTKREQGIARLDTIKKGSRIRLAENPKKIYEVVEAFWVRDERKERGVAFVAEDAENKSLPGYLWLKPIPASLSIWELVGKE